MRGVIEDLPGRGGERRGDRSPVHLCLRKDEGEDLERVDQALKRDGNPAIRALCSHTASFRPAVYHSIAPIGAYLDNL